MSTTCARSATAGAAGALVATALHRGVIGAPELAELHDRLQVRDERSRDVGAVAACSPCQPGIPLSSST